MHQPTSPLHQVLTKHHDNPILIPNPHKVWEKAQEFNPGVILLNNTFYMLYRAIGNDGISRLGYAQSSDGIHFQRTSQLPAFEHHIVTHQTSLYSYASGGSLGGCEDPRLVHMIDEKKIYMTYTACDGGLRVGLTAIDQEDFVKKNWNWQQPRLISPAGQIHKNWLLFPEKINGTYAILHSIKPSVQIAYLNRLDGKTFPKIQSAYYGAPRKNCWDIWIRGAGAPPLKTQDGWLVFYHAMDNNWGQYKIGAMLLDLENPTIVLHRSKTPLIIPDQPYENTGFKPGVVYLTGAVIKDETLFVYYGCSDNYIGVATAPYSQFLATLKQLA